MDWIGIISILIIIICILIVKYSQRECGLDIDEMFNSIPKSEIRFKYPSNRIGNKVEKISSAYYMSIRPGAYHPGIDEDTFRKWDFFDEEAHDNVYLYFKDCTIYEIDEIINLLPDYVEKAIKNNLKEIEGSSEFNDMDIKVNRYFPNGNLEYQGSKINGKGTFFTLVDQLNTRVK